jgi:alpha-L-fucosidase
MKVTAEERLKWWHAARFGMFIHWGLYASLAGVWKGKKIPGIGEWIMRNAKIPIKDYEKLAKNFNPVKFNAEAWAEVAKQAGMKYLVITAKHHDGFCMFNSKSNPYNIAKQTPFGRDPMKELAAACRKRGIKMCFYYSQDLDWHAPGGAGHWDEVGKGKGWISYARPPEDFQKYLDDVVKPNLTELLTNYGPIGLIWFDVPATISRKQSISLRDLVHKLQPKCLVSGRIGNDVGDYGSLGDNEHPAGKVNGAWETPATLNDTWGFKKDDHNWKSLEYLLHLLVNCASKGVNYLLNVGPTDKGVIPQPSVELLKQVGAWLKRNGEAIYGTQASPFFVDPAWGRVTCKGNTMYLLIKEWPAGELKLCGLLNKVRAAKILGKKGKKVTFKQEGDTVTFVLPRKAPEKIISVVAVTVDGTPKAEQILIQDGSGSIRLPVANGAIKGKFSMRNGSSEGWKKAGGSISWKCRVKSPGVYEAVAVTLVNPAHPERFGNHVISLSVGKTTIKAKVGVKDMGKPGKSEGLSEVRSRMGRVKIEKAGVCAMRVVADRIDRKAFRGLRLSAIELLPVK